MNIATRLPIIFLGMLSLIVGVLAGLARLAVDVPTSAATQAGNHGALMIAAFLGTVISLERAVALASAHRIWPYLAPLCAGLGGLALLSDIPIWVAQALFIIAGSLLTAASTLILRQQPALYTSTLALGALSWLIGSIAWGSSSMILIAVPWWMAFLVLTIAGERLELTRFLPTPAAAKRAFTIIVAVLLAGMSMAFWQEELGLSLYASGLVLLSLWLLRYDIARHTVKQTGLPRYIAVCLLSGYIWLAFGGLLGALGGFSPGSSLRDAALHAVFLGFVFSMIFGHAPIIFPAVARIKIPYHPAFYLQLGVLHASLLMRVVGDLGDMLPVRQAAAIANSIALLTFVVTMVVSALRGRSNRFLKYA
ncbi:MAG: hypothetical protein NTY41_06495 [Proteobacteria bacterium]|nr:hypothetical protein [Pseudomonadota bacterium]